MRFFSGISIILLLIIWSSTITIAASTIDCEKCHQANYDAWSDSPHNTEPAINDLKPDTKSCLPCHTIKPTRPYSTYHGEVTDGSPDCEMCHQAPAEGFDTHITTPSEAIPGSNISAELCASCHIEQHKGIYREWNEYDSEVFNPETMVSHSKPSNTEESEVFNSITCVSCKSTEGAILNIEDGELYDLSEDVMPEPEDITEWRITCVACHEPHSAGLRTTATQLCASCHNSGGIGPDGNTTVLRYNQWEMYNGSIFTNGIHSVDLECIDCHMATMVENNETTVNGHSFDVQPLLLSDQSSGNICKRCHVVSHNGTPVDNECDDCHDIALSNIISVKQGTTKDRLQELELLEENASIALTMINNSSKYQKQLENYNNALFYMSGVKNDGSFGVHNPERVTDNLDMAESLLYSVVEEEIGVSREETTTPALGIFTSLMAVMGVVLGFRRKRNR